jgi:hypothetical protein
MVFMGLGLGISGLLPLIHTHRTWHYQYATLQWRPIIARVLNCRQPGVYVGGRMLRYGCSHIEELYTALESLSIMMGIAGVCSIMIMA